jgi:16S rRNA G966 N2-methylase RsmD
MINNLFPVTDYSKLQYDFEGLYSITNPSEAEETSDLIKSNFTNSNLLNIFDGTGGLGGNTINFSNKFKTVTTCELNKERYIMLVNNIDQYNLKNVIKLNNDCIDYLFKNYNNFDVYFFDPPWGGPTYKKHKKLSLTIGTKTLLEIAQYLKTKVTNKLLVYKIPYNYDLNEFFEFDYKLHKINKYYIIILMI